MKRRFEPVDWDVLRNRVIGLGEESHKKSHYALSRARLRALERFRHLLDASDEIILVADAKSGVIVDANGGASRRLGDGLVGRDLGQFYEDWAELADLMANDATTGRHVSPCLQGVDGRRFATDGSATLELVDRAPFMSLVVQDVTAQRLAQAVLQEERDRSQLYLDTVQAIMVALDTQGRITMLNPFGCRLLGYEVGELLGKNWFATCLPQPEGEDVVRPYFAQLLRGEANCRDYFENHLVTATGRRVLVAWRNALLRDDAGHPIGTLSAGEDITARRAAEDAVHSLAFYDPLTGLPNRRLLLDRLQHSMAASIRNLNHQALLFLDLDHFKMLNDTQGHDQGDRLLVETARRLQTCVREGDTVSRHGGDEFVLLLEQLSTEVGTAAVQAENVAEKIIARLSEPCELDKVVHRGTVSVGITLFVGEDVPVDDLLKRADLAMYQAKAAGRNAMRFFDPAMQARVSARAAMEGDLRHAVTADEFVLHFQPQVDRGGVCVGVEALIRWNNPSRGIVFPGQFIQLAEETGLIQPIGRWVIREACARLAKWQREPDAAGLSIAVNVSVHQFKQPDFVADVQAAIDASGIDPCRLKLEITESLLVEDVDDVIAKMSALKRIGVSFSLDDFGTGYSSLAYVKRLPLDQLKIDQSFVRDVVNDPNDAVICRAVIGLGRSLGINTIAEGVETALQRAFLLAEGCGGAQGNLFAKPMPGGQLLDWLRQRREAAPGLT
jgi:diguanylate cyclase (GGDEF)-like protein/PAS domain S-box-containing protein